MLTLNKVSVTGPLFTKAWLIGVGKLQLKNIYLQKNSRIPMLVSPVNAWYGVWVYLLGHQMDIFVMDK